MLISLLKMIKFNKNLEGTQQSDQENGGSCAKLSIQRSYYASPVFKSYDVVFR